LVYLGREYPAGYTDFFRPKLKAAFLKKKDITDEQEILQSIKFGEYIIKGAYNFNRMIKKKQGNLTLFFIYIQRA
jgi:hypothetical protein